MKLATLTTAALAALLGMATTRVDAAVVYFNDFTASNLGSPGSFSDSTASFAGGGAATITFSILGRKTLDGLNPGFTDVFTFSLNSTPIFSGTFDMGGGGTNMVLFEPAGTTTAPLSFGFGLGGKTDVSIPITLLAGVNLLTFAYGGVNQGITDESWTIGPVSIDAALDAQTPLPAALPLFASVLAVGGFVGWQRSRRKRAL